MGTTRDPGCTTCDTSRGPAQRLHVELTPVLCSVNAGGTNVAPQTARERGLLRKTEFTLNPSCSVSTKQTRDAMTQHTKRNVWLWLATQDSLT